MVQAKFCEDNIWLPHEMSLELCQQQALKQHKYFLARDLAFMRDVSQLESSQVLSQKVIQMLFGF